MFKDYVVLITGAASGIGYSASQLFIQEQATVIGVDLDDTALDRTRTALGEHFVPRACDVSNEAQVAATAQFVEKEFGKLDILIS